MGNRGSRACATDPDPCKSLGVRFVSVVIPALNEASCVAQTVRRVRGGAGELKVEVIVVDGGSQDATAREATGAGARVVSSARGRAKQMNMGAKASSPSSDVLLFLHADTLLPEDWATRLCREVENAGTGAAGAAAGWRRARRDESARDLWGCFEFTTDSSDWLMRVVEAGTNLRTRIAGLPYGDQGIFVSRAAFRAVGGFRDVPLLEDVHLVRDLSRRTSRRRPVVVPVPAVTSARRWASLGVLQTTALNAAIMAAWAMGFKEDQLAQWYKRGRVALASTQRLE